MHLTTIAQCAAGLCIWPSRFYMSQKVLYILERRVLKLPIAGHCKRNPFKISTCMSLTTYRYVTQSLIVTILIQMTIYFFRPDLSYQFINRNNKKAQLCCSDVNLNPDFYFRATILDLHQCELGQNLLQITYLLSNKFKVPFSFSFSYYLKSKPVIAKNIRPTFVHLCQGLEKVKIIFSSFLFQIQKWILFNVMRE